MPTGNLSNIHIGLRLYRGFWSAVDWIYPPTCPGCEKLGERWCAACQVKVQQLQGDLCPKCGMPGPQTVVCAQCQADPPPYAALRSWGRYNGPLREAIHRLKYRHDLGLAEALSRHLIERFRSLAWSIDLITAVPLSPGRLRERGYNQSGLLARPVALAQRISYQPGAIFRKRETASQVGLSAQDRRKNVHDAFTARPHLVKGKNILILDDVATTCSTLNACATALLQAGARGVYGLTLARAMGPEDYEKKV